MVPYREILRLHSLNYSQRQIEASAHCSRHTIRDVLAAAKEADIRWPLEDSVTNEMLEGAFHPDRLTTANPRKEPNYSHIHKELARSGVNLTLLWSEYCEECRINGNTPYMLPSSATNTAGGRVPPRRPCASIINPAMPCRWTGQGIRFRSTTR